MYLGALGWQMLISCIFTGHMWLGNEPTATVDSTPQYIEVHVKSSVGFLSTVNSQLISVSATLKMQKKTNVSD